jgi:hypothetical protein
MTALDGAPPLDDAPSVPSTPLPPRPRPNLLSPFGWATPEEETMPAPATGETLDLEAAGDLSPSATDWPSDETGEWDENTETSSPASSADSKPAQLLSKHQMRRTAEQAVKMGGGMAHTVAAKTPEAKHVGLYLADDDDARSIGHPLADIMHRRGDIVGGKLSPDANSALQAFMGLAGYLTKQVVKVGQIRELQTPGQAPE